MQLEGVDDVGRRSAATATAPRFGSSSTSPSAASMLIASRKGVRETRSCSARARSLSLAPGLDRAFDDQLAQPRADLLVQHRWRQGDDAGHRWDGLERHFVCKTADENGADHRGSHA